MAGACNGGGPEWLAGGWAATLAVRLKYIGADTGTRKLAAAGRHTAACVALLATPTPSFVFSALPPSFPAFLPWLSVTVS